MKIYAIVLLLTATNLTAQELYQAPAGARSRVSSFENLNGVKGQGGKGNATAKGHAFESLKAGESKTLLNIQGAGKLQRIWCTISDRSPKMLRSLRLRMYWDGAAQPAVDVPLGDFFGAALLPVAFQSALLSDPEGRSFNSTIPMPFRTSAKAVITNEGSQDLELLFFDIDYITLPKLEPGDLYFHACWSRTRHASVGQDAVLLPKVVGRGRLLGVSVGVNIDPVYGPTWWGEGEVKAWLDGDTKYPTINGTGAEDYIGTGWGEGRFAHQYQGCLVADSPKNQYAFYRWHIPDAIYFDKDCRVGIQQIGGFFADTVIAMQGRGVPLKPISLAGPRGFRGLFEPGQERALDKAEHSDWLNFYRSDDYAATAYFYLDRPVSNLPALAAVGERYP
ncbi:MAG TPA: glycoside hydrolase family 172 protein [Puia sp.]|nr:glycoside hydrolase family 172 protein [Puia sp.]